MPLNSFSIEDVDAIRKVECEEVPSLMVIAGPNGVGKSTLFEELKTRIGRGRNQGVRTIGDVEPVYFSPHRAPGPSDISTTLLTTLSRKSYRSSLAQGRYNINARQAPQFIRQQSQRSRHRADFAPYFEVKKRLAQFEFDKGNLLSEIYDNMGEVPEGHLPDINKPLKSAIDAVLPGIEYLGVQDDSQEYKIFFKDRSEHKVEFDRLSSGEKDAIAMLFLLVERRIEDLIASARDEEPEEEDLVMLIDSPEAYLHPAMQERFLDFVENVVNQPLTEREELTIDLQVIMCTHSRQILENTADQNLYFFLYQDQRPDNQLVSATDISTDALEVIAGELGVSALSSGQPLLIVEGKTDREYIRKFHPDKKDSLEIVPMGGKGQISSFNQSFNELVPELYSSGIFIFALVDRDRDINIQDEYEEFVFQLPTTCMENFLIDPEALYKSLETLVGETDLHSMGYEESEDIERLIDETLESDSFKKKEIETRLNEELTFYISTNQINVLDEEEEIHALIDEVAEKKKERISSTIKDVRNKTEEYTENGELDRLNGKVILGEIASRFGQETEVLGRTVAENMAKEERQPAGLTAILEEIENTVDDHSHPESVFKS